MPVTSKIEGVDKTVASLKKKAMLVASAGGSVIVGYTQAYAVYVHEDTEANHPNGGQAKFLEQPARELKKEFGKIIRQAVGKGYTVVQALLLCGLRLQKESQKLVPVDTGALKASAFMKQE